MPTRHCLNLFRPQEQEYSIIYSFIQIVRPSEFNLKNLNSYKKVWFLKMSVDITNEILALRLNSVFGLVLTWNAPIACAMSIHA